MTAIDRPVVTAFEEIHDSSGLGDLVALDRLDTGWCNRTTHLNLGGPVLGGQIAAHCLVAAAGSATGFLASALYILFVAAPASDHGWRIDTEALRTGRRFAHRLARLTQDGRFIAHGTALLGAATSPDAMLRHFPAMPPVPPPEVLASRGEIHLRGEIDAFSHGMMTGHDYMEIRPVPDDAVDLPPGPGSRSFYWLRMPLATGFDQVTQQALLTMATDFWFSLPLHRLASRQGISGWTLTTSLDHCIWFHSSVDCSQWLLFQAEATVAADGVGMKRAMIWQQDGNLVANVEQRAIAG